MSNQSLVSIFTEIYSKETWKEGVSCSGPGSNPEATKDYLEVIQRFLSEQGVRSVVDFGCGDWAFSRLIDWTRVDYLGLDLVQTVVQRNQAEFGSPNIRFAVGDLTEGDLPSADLLLCKDVFQHLPNAIVSDFLARKILRYRWAILTNDYRITIPGGWRNFWRPCDNGGIPNSEIDAGGHHPLLLRLPPFNLKAKVLLRYDVVVAATTFKKEVLLWENPNVKVAS